MGTYCSVLVACSLTHVNHVGLVLYTQAMLGILFLRPISTEYSMSYAIRILAYEIERTHLEDNTFQMLS